MDQSYRNKLILLGLDGATFDLIKPWVEEGKLPTFAKILSGGSSSLLRSTLPPVTPLAWSTLINGTNPGSHGIFGFLNRRPGTYDWYPVNAGERGGLSFWDWAAKYDRKIGVYNMPMTYPPQTIQNGFMISGMGVPDIDVRFTAPAALKEELLDVFLPEQLVEQPVGLFDQDSYLDYLLQSVESNLAITNYLLQQYPDLDLLCSVFVSTDRVQHFYWQQMMEEDAPESMRLAIEKIYRSVDDALAGLIEAYPDRNLVIISDHGAGGYDHLINVNQWLHDNGWLFWTTSKESPKESSGSAWKNVYRNIGRALPATLRRRLKSYMPEATMARIRQEYFHWSPSIEWSKTKAYSASFGGNIFLNLNGREPWGTVNAGSEAEVLISQIRLRLLDMVDPQNGSKVVKEVHLGRDIYKGSFVDQAPDLVIEWHDGYYSMAGMGDGSSGVFQGRLRWPNSDAVHSAEHRLHGIFMAYGPGIRKGHHFEGANIIDIAPTLLHLLDVPIPNLMEGKVLEQIVGNPQRPRPMYIEADALSEIMDSAEYSPSEEAEMMRQLRDLGYIE